MAFTQVDPATYRGFFGQTAKTPATIATNGYNLREDPNVPPVATAGYDEAITRLQGLPAMINDLYAKLVNAGREEDAYLLADAAQRFARSGSAQGINSFARAQALQDLTNRMAVARQTKEAGLSATQTSNLMQIEKDIAQAGVDKANTAFQQGMEQANYAQKQQQIVRDQVAQQNALNVARTQRTVAAPVSTGATAAEAFRTKTLANTATPKTVAPAASTPYKFAWSTPQAMHGTGSSIPVSGWSSGNVGGSDFNNYWKLPEQTLRLR